ncbi:unnamed protein product [Acanthosepion pharaonis]|uniref:Uncharacterized protein n=1 Tax=Acanthosepion pharaonis TaxID=158019 RepID=A0A812E2V3_ACAPH|nr:unnamed protein product [Sepia pharaonis]
MPSFPPLPFSHVLISFLSFFTPSFPHLLFLPFLLPSFPLSRPLSPSSFFSRSYLLPLLFHIFISALPFSHFLTAYLSSFTISFPLFLFLTSYISSFTDLFSIIFSPPTFLLSHLLFSSFFSRSYLLPLHFHTFFSPPPFSHFITSYLSSFTPSFLLFLFLISYLSSFTDLFFIISLPPTFPLSHPLFSTFLFLTCVI